MPVSPRVGGVSSKPTDISPSPVAQRYFSNNCTTTKVTYEFFNELIENFTLAQIAYGVTNVPNDAESLKKICDRLRTGGYNFTVGTLGLGGTLTTNNNSIHLGTGNLSFNGLGNDYLSFNDTTNDYSLFADGTISNASLRLGTIKADKWQLFNGTTEVAEIRIVNDELIIENKIGTKPIKVISRANFEVTLDADSTPSGNALFAVKRGDGTVMGSIDEQGLIGGSNINIASTGNIPTINTTTGNIATANTTTTNATTVNTITTNTTQIRNTGSDFINIEENLNVPKDLTTPNALELSRVNGFIRAAANVNANGTMNNSRGVASCTRNSTGTYTIVLSEPVPLISFAGIYNINSAFFDAIGGAAYINSTTYTVKTRLHDGSLADYNFLFQVTY